MVKDVGDGLRGLPRRLKDPRRWNPGVIERDQKSNRKMQNCAIAPPEALLRRVDSLRDFCFA